MRQNVTTFKTLKHCIKEMQKFILDGKHLESGKKLNKFDGMRSREILGCWVIAAVFNHVNQSDELKICTNPNGGDGTLYDVSQEQTYFIEQVMVSNWADGRKNPEEVIIEQITNKQEKGGAAYASGKILVVFLNRKGVTWKPNSVAKKLPEKLDFNEVWVFGLKEENKGSYTYNVTLLDKKNSPIWEIIIDADFENWRVKQIQ